MGGRRDRRRGGRRRAERVGDDAGLGRLRLLQLCGDVYEDGEADPAEIKTSGDSFVTPFFANVRARLGWLRVVCAPDRHAGVRHRPDAVKPPPARPASTTRPARKGRRAAATSSCRRAPCTTAASRPPAADVLYLLTCFPRGGRRHDDEPVGLWTAAPERGRGRRRSKTRRGSTKSTGTSKTLCTRKRVISPSRRRRRLADTAEIVLSFVSTRQPRDGRALRAVPRRLARALRRRNLPEELAGLGDAQGDYVEASRPRSLRRSRGATANSTAASGPLVRCLSVYKLTSALDKGVSKPAKLLGDKGSG